MFKLGYCGLVANPDMDNDFITTPSGTCNTYIQNLNSKAKYSMVNISGGEYDTVYFDNNADISFDDTYNGLPSVWGATTALFAKFNGNLSAGNLDFSLEKLDYILISKRELTNPNSFIFKPVCVISAEDFEKNNGATFFDRLVGHNKQYEYKATPVLRDGIEAASLFAVYDTDKTIKFTGHYIFDGTSEWHCNINTSLDWTRNRTGSIVNPINTKFPYKVTTSQNNYDTITISGSHFKVDCSKPESDIFDIYSTAEYNMNYDDFITNNKAKLIRDWSGRMWIAELDGNVEHHNNGHYNFYDTSHSFVEIADYNDENALYKYGFSNYNPKNMVDDMSTEPTYGASILITITNYDSIPIINKEITLLLNNIEVWKTTSNSSGQASVYNLDAGFYTVVVGAGINAVKRYFSISDSSQKIIPIDIKVGE